MSLVPTCTVKFIISYDIIVRSTSANESVYVTPIQRGLKGERPCCLWTTDKKSQGSAVDPSVD